MKKPPSHHHDIGYKELFSYPEMVQQLIEGFAPKGCQSIVIFVIIKLTNNKKEIRWKSTGLQKQQSN